MKKLSALISGFVLLSAGSGLALAQGHGDGSRASGDGNRSNGGWQGNNGGQQYSAPQGGRSHNNPGNGGGYRAEPGRGYGGHGGYGGPAHGYYGSSRGYYPSSRGYYAPSRGYYAPSRGYYAPYRYYGAPALGYYAPAYYDYPVYERPVYISQEVVVQAPPTVVYQPQPPLAQLTPRPQPAPQPLPPPQAAPRKQMDRYTLSAKELFAFDRHELRMPQPKLDEIASVLISNPQIGLVNITGYTDRLGTDSYNLKLSQQRADAVRTYLTSKGVTSNRLNAIGKGESNPVVECHNKNRAELIQCLEPNRRVEVEQITIELQH